MSENSIRIRPLHCGSIRVSPLMPYGGARDLKRSARMAYAPDAERIDLPCIAWLIEHPKARILVDTGLCREISPEGEYDRDAVKRVLPAALASLYRPWVPMGQTAAEQPAALAYVLPSHDPDIALEP